MLSSFWVQPTFSDEHRQPCVVDAFVKVLRGAQLLLLLPGWMLDAPGATFSFCCCCSCSCCSFCSKDSSRMGKHHGSEGRKSVKIATKNSLISKLRNGASATLKQQGPEGRKSIKIATKNSSETAPPPRSNSRALKDGKASKLRPKSA